MSKYKPKSSHPWRTSFSRCKKLKKDELMEEKELDIHTLGILIIDVYKTLQLITNFIRNELLELSKGELYHFHFGPGPEKDKEKVLQKSPKKVKRSKET